MQEDSSPLLPQKNPITKRVSWSLRFIILVVIALVALILVGYIIATLLHVHNTGIFGQVNELKKENSQLKTENNKYQQQNDYLQSEIKNITTINKKLSEEAIEFRVENLKFQESLKTLNETNQHLNILLVALEDKSMNACNFTKDGV
eukprot:TRINITY_DN9532_c0_g1_i2.p1 TRINITY_DN9532_c0_g1~~TRINITY_DN9532_c0_g1_i2.p1  ORF type:complete len:147 (+),score=0.26 TRINITY_DN9532_c0_g1_i2:114-554(+)